MPVGLYMDEHIPRAITMELRRRGVPVLTAQDDDMAGKSDPQLLDRATALGRALFSMDDDLLREATRRQQAGETFGGVIYAHQLGVSIGECVRDLELLSALGSPDEMQDAIEYLPY